VRNGATANPLNLAAEDARLNRARGDVRYDLDGDEVVNVMATVTARGPPDTVGPDAEGEWVPPSRSHGDIARAVLYMTLVYRLPLPLDARWLGWIADDPPSAQERAFNIWTRRRWRIGNPLVEHPAMVGELAFALRWT
jgi:endonuclease I